MSERSSASNSSAIQPIPTPRMKRPSDSQSIVEATLAQCTGSRYVVTSTLTPSLTDSVAPARNASAVIDSRNGFSGGTMNDPDQL